jgi:hypothetical protein
MCTEATGRARSRALWFSGCCGSGGPAVELDVGQRLVHSVDLVAVLGDQVAAEPLVLRGLLLVQALHMRELLLQRPLRRLVPPTVTVDRALLLEGARTEVVVELVRIHPHPPEDPVLGHEQQLASGDVRERHLVGGPAIRLGVPHLDGAATSTDGQARVAGDHVAGELDERRHDDARRHVADQVVAHVVHEEREVLKPGDGGLPTGLVGAELLPEPVAEAVTEAVSRDLAGRHTEARLVGLVQVAEELQPLLLLGSGVAPTSAHHLVEERHQPSVSLPAVLRVAVVPDRAGAEEQLVVPLDVHVEERQGLVAEVVPHRDAGHFASPAVQQGEVRGDEASQGATRHVSIDTVSSLLCLRT